MIKPTIKLTVFNLNHHMGTVSAIIKIHFLPLPFSSPHVNNFFAWTPALLNEFGIALRTHVSSF